MTQDFLAAKVCVSRQTINAIEKGEYNPTIKLCRATCRVLDKSLDDLFWEGEDENDEFIQENFKMVTGFNRNGPLWHIRFKNIRTAYRPEP